MATPRGEIPEITIPQVPFPGVGRSSQPQSPDGFREPLPIVRTDSEQSGDYETDMEVQPSGLTSRRGSRSAVDAEGPRGHKSTLDLIALSISMAGAQIIWTMELGWGTPFLLKLGLSEQGTSLVWLAGPISGLVAQPLIGDLAHLYSLS